MSPAQILGFGSSPATVASPANSAGRAGFCSCSGVLRSRSSGYSSAVLY